MARSRVGMISPCSDDFDDLLGRTGDVLRPGADWRRAAGVALRAAGLGLGRTPGPMLYDRPALDRPLVRLLSLALEGLLSLGTAGSAAVPAAVPPLSPDADGLWAAAAGTLDEH